MSLIEGVYLGGVFLVVSVRRYVDFVFFSVMVLLGFFYWSLVGRRGCV